VDEDARTMTLMQGRNHEDMVTALMLSTHIPGAVVGEQYLVGHPMYT